jgi:hypothetical protein
MFGDPSTQKFIADIINNYSSGFRTYKNTLIFLIVDPNEYDGFKRIVRRFLALNAIKIDKETMKRLTEEDRERVEQKLKDLDSSIPIKILSLYRYMAKALKGEVKIFDLGIPTVGDRITLTARLKDYLKDQEILLEKLSPKVLFERTFSKEDESKTIAEIWEAFLKFSELPILENEQVLRNAVVQGVQNGMFGLQIEDKIHYAETISPVIISEEASIIRKEIAQKLKGEVGEKTTGEEGAEGTGVRGGGVAVEGIRKIAFRVKVPWDKLSEMVRGVFAPLSREGAQISLEVKIEAKSERGISRNILDLTIKETLNQIGAEVLEEKKE